jgi:hypothetical protein
MYEPQHAESKTRSQPIALTPMGARPRPVTLNVLCPDNR